MVRLNSNGMMDSSFDTGTGPAGDIYAIIIQPDGKILVGGTFSSFSSYPTPYLVRLDSSGKVDNSFDAGTGPDDWVKCIVLQPDGRVVIGGNFATVNGTACSHIARLTSGGALDPAFNPAASTSDSIVALVRQSNGLLVLGGGFTIVNGSARTGLARVGSTDLKINSIQVQSNRVAKVALTGQSGLGFTLEGSSNLITWSTVATGVSSASSVSVQDTQSVSLPVRYYRTRSR